MFAELPAIRQTMLPTDDSKLSVEVHEKRGYRQLRPRTCRKPDFAGTVRYAGFTSRWTGICKHKPTFCEQVTCVNVRFCFSFIGSFFAVVSCCRMLLSTEFLFALLKSFHSRSSVPVGVREKSRCCHLSDGLYSQSRLAVIGTRCRRNG
jgi:hypothetical protein